MFEINLSQDELVEQVIERAASKLCSHIDEDDYTRLSGIVERATATAVQQYIDATVVPMIQGQIETITLQATNKWGEKKGESVTFREYIVERAEAWLSETVNYDGKARGEDSFNWKGTQTRLAHMIHQHFHYSIERAIKDMLKTANGQLVDGIQRTVEKKLGEIQAALKVTTATR